MAIKLSDIKLNDQNPRKATDRQIEKLAKSISEFPKMMALRPIIVDDDNVVLAGNMRYRALRLLGKTEIPNAWVKKASTLTDEERRRLVIVDNANFVEWDYDSLGQWDIGELGNWGVGENVISNIDIPKFEPVDESEVPDFMREKKLMICPECGHEWAV